MYVTVIVTTCDTNTLGVFPAVFLPTAPHCKTYPSLEVIQPPSTLLAYPKTERFSQCKAKQ